MNRKFFHGLALLGVAACAPLPNTPAINQPAPPRLLVFITVDALRPDYFVRFDRHLNGGLARLYRNGAVFTNGFQDHGITETAPGHSTMLSGRFPLHTGIAKNAAGVEDPNSPLIEAPGPGASPFRFRGTTLADWMLAKDPRTRVLSVSRKDRGAILPIGRSKQPVFWYAGNGNFTTSTYYSSSLPEWVREFNTRKLASGYAGRAWELFLPATEYPEPDSVPVESQGVRFTFPHVLSANADSALRLLPDFPWMDDLTLAFALHGVNALQLGAGPQTDILAISLSTTDAVGHRYGPDSREIHDQIVRLDRSLGQFLDSLFRIRSQSDVIVTLTADHGMAPFPGIKSYDPNADVVRVNVEPLLKEIDSSLGAAGVRGASLRSVGGPLVGRGFSFDRGVLELDHAALRAANVNADSLVERFRAAFLRTPGIARADRISELALRDTVTDHVARRWLHAFAPDDDVALLVSPAPYSSWFAFYGATHGTPNDVDARVPIIFYGGAFRPGRYSGFARVVDMAPTLAQVLRVTPGERIDGRPLFDAIR